jgi:hypothetical protein
MKWVPGSLLLVLLAAGTAAASERHFTYTYESAVLNPGGRELEPWTTFRLGKSGYFTRLDTRVEIELGLTDRLQTSLYLNLGAQTADTAEGRQTQTELSGISSEWKYKLSDPVADAVGSALYTEVSAGPSETDIEGKLILDKRVGRLLAALNVTGEYEWDLAEQQTARETKLEIDAAACWFLSPGLSAGLELRSHSVFPAGEGLTRSALFLGPVVAYSRGRLWVAASVLPQIYALAGASEGHLDLVEHERVEARVLFGMDF